MQAAYDFCPTGNEADLPGVAPTAVALKNPLRLGAIPFDELTKLYFGYDGTVSADYTGIGTQAPGRRYGNTVGSPGIIPSAMPELGGGGLALGPRSFDYGTALAANLGLGLFKTAVGSADVLAGGHCPRRCRSPSAWWRAQ